MDLRAFRGPPVAQVPRPKSPCVWTNGTNGVKITDGFECKVMNGSCAREAKFTFLLVITK